MVSVDLYADLSGFVLGKSGLKSIGTVNSHLVCPIPVGVFDFAVFVSGSENVALYVL